VRAFGLEKKLKRASARDLPLPIEIPSAYRKMRDFEAVSCMAYSIHQYVEGRPTIGDIAIKLRKRDLANGS
jgi:hypothetical protein